MSNDTNEETLSLFAAGQDGGGPPPARKRAARKSAASAETSEASAAEKPAKKVAKKAAKKVAKKAAKKAAKSASASEDAAAAPETSAPPEAPAVDLSVPKKATRARKVAVQAETESAPATESQTAPPAAPEASSESTAEHRRIGRVPGGGPVGPRETVAEREVTPEQAPLPARPPQGSQAGPAESGQSPAAHPRESQGQRESRSKRRREKRKRRNQERQVQSPPQHGNRHDGHPRAPHHEPKALEPAEQRPAQLSGPKIEADGMLELAPKGFGFLRLPGKNFEQARDDVFVTPETIRKYNLRLGQWVHGVYQQGPRGPQLVEVSAVNDLNPAEAAKLPHFDELKAINPTRRISFETTPERFTTRVLDIMAPVGRGQRGLIVSPPRSGKTTMLLHMAEAIREKYDEAIHLMVLLVDERPEEVTEFRRALPGAEIYASSNDEQARNHCRIAELAIERAKRLVEAGRDVFLLMDSITRLARAYNNTMNNRGRGTGSGGITIGALEVPRRLFAAARNTRGGGSLTILATALIQTNSRADEAIFMEFKGTGNMELVLDRKIAENYIYPAVDIFKSGTRREELLIPDHMLHKIHLIRRGLSGHRPVEAMERLLFFLKKFPNNPQMLLEIKG
jgi:transcription termination factor Rho